MAKCIGAVLIIVGCGGVGICMRTKLYDTIKQIEELLILLRTISNEIMYHKSALDEICIAVSDRTTSPFGLILRGIVLQCNERPGAQFGEVWKEEFANAKGMLILPNEIQSIVEDSFLSYSISPDVQYTRLQENIEKIEDQLSKCKEDCKNKGRLYICIGVMTGLISTILLI